MIETIDKLIRASRALVQELGREPTSEELAKRMDIPAPKVRMVLRIAQQTISLETPIGAERDSHLGDVIEDRQVVSLAEAMINVDLQEQTESVLKTLTPREEQVIKIAVRRGRRQRAHARGGRPPFGGHPRAHPPDRGHGAPQAPPLVMQPKASCVI
jgi:DNA-directed RNA polymerase sigma subunit (sigma70/sigma32)